MIVQQWCVISSFSFKKQILSNIYCRLDSINPKNINHASEWVIPHTWLGKATIYVCITLSEVREQKLVLLSCQLPV